MGAWQGCDSSAAAARATPPAHGRRQVLGGGRDRVVVRDAGHRQRLGDGELRVLTGRDRLVLGAELHRIDLDDLRRFERVRRSGPEPEHEIAGLAGAERALREVAWSVRRVVVRVINVGEFLDAER